MRLSGLNQGRVGFDHETLTRLIADRIAFVPRYRQVVGAVPGNLANPVWVDDPDFEVGIEGQVG